MMSLSGRKIRNTVGISLIGVTQAMAGGFVGLYISMFYTDVMGIAVGAAALIILVLRLWDAFNDPIAGVLMDNTKFSRFGQFKPYILVSNILLGVFTILMFIDPQLSASGNIIWAIVMYFCWTMAYTFLPIVPMISNVVVDPKERESVIGIQRLVILFIGLTASGFIPLAEAFGGAQKGFAMAISIFMIPMTILSTIGVLMLKEVGSTTVKPEKILYRDIPKLFVKNRPMQIFTLYVFGSGMVAPFMSATLVYYIKYHFGIEKMALIFPVTMLAFAAGVSLSAFLTSRVFSRNRFLMGVYLVQAIAFVTIYFFGASTFWFSLLMIFFVNMTLGSIITAETAMSMEIMDYVQFTKGKKMHGLISCIHTFFARLQPSIAGATVGFTLSAVGFVANAELTPEVSKTLLVVGFLLPALFSLLSFFIVKHYPITQEKAYELRQYALSHDEQ